MATLEFFYDVASPYSYLAATRVDREAEAAGVPVRWRPFLLGGVFRAVNNQPPANVPARARFMLEDLKRWAAHVEAPFQFSPHFPSNSLLAMRALTTLRDDPARLRAASQALFAACWVRGEDIQDPAVVAACLGDDAPAVLAAAVEPANKEALKAVTAEAVDRGAFGAPTFLVGEQHFFGNDRLSFALRAAQG